VGAVLGRGDGELLADEHPGRGAIVTFSEERSVTDTYSVAMDPNRTMVYALWQLVDVFVIVDKDENRFTFRAR